MSKAIEMAEFPWTYDQHQRYRVLEEFLKIFYPGSLVSTSPENSKTAGIIPPHPPLEKGGSTLFPLEGGESTLFPLEKGEGPVGPVIARSEATWRSPNKNLILEVATRPSGARNDKKKGDSAGLPGISGEISVLDVGGLSPDRTGQSHWLPIKHVAPGPAVSLDLLPWDEPGYVRGDGRSIPFGDGSFDIVSALDVLEHIAQDERAGFLKELSRVAKRAVFVSAPFRSPEIEAAEELLESQMERLYGTVQCQLLEHRKFGLPHREFVAGILSSVWPAGTDFSYGSLKTWLPYQTLKNGYMMRRNAGTIQSLLDAWMTALAETSEFEPPFARHYWLYAKGISQKEMEEKAEKLKARLRHGERAFPAMGDLERLHREIVDFQTKKRVSAVAVHGGRLDFLEKSVRSILTQIVDFDLEVAVWDLTRSDGCARFVRERFPGVAYLTSSPGAVLPNALLQAAARLFGDQILMLSEDIVLPPDAAKLLAEEMSRSTGVNLISPRVTDEMRHEHVRLGPRDALEKSSAGSFGPLPAGAEAQTADWISSGCFLFRREALWERKNDPRPLDITGLFLWQRADEGKLLKYAGGIEVYTKPVEIPPGMKILHCMHQYHPARGGSEWLMQNASEKLAARKHGVKVIATNAYSTEDYFLPGRGKDLMPAGEEEINGVAVARVPFNRRGAALLNLLRAAANRLSIPYGNHLRMLSWGPRSRAYKREIRLSSGVDLIAACPLPNVNVWYAWRAAKKRGLPFVVIPCYHTEDRWSFHNELYFKIMREADAVITLTEWEKDYLVREGGVERGKVYTLGVGIDAENDADPSIIDIRKKSGIREKEIVLFLGQHGRHKGILDLLFATRYVWKERPDVALVIAGNPTAHTAEIEENIRTLAPGEQKRIYLIKGFPAEEKRAFMRSADVFVSVSPFESFGIVYLEAWLEKRAVIGCRTGASAKLIEEFKDGLLVHARNPIELSGAILELLEHPEVREKMGRAGRAKALRQYRWDRIIDRWEFIYHDAIQRRRNSR